MRQDPREPVDGLTLPTSSQTWTVLHGRLRWRVILQNLPLLLGLAIVLVLVLVALVGPRFAAENPYLSGMRGTERIDGQLLTPPFAPSAQFPLGSDRWGRDLLSLLLYGARNTLVACLFITTIRLTLGVTLGGLAGWRAGTLVDRTVMAAIEMMSSLPLLITGMILIYALDIRRGLSVFMVALSLIGWGEIAQYTRSEFISLRERPFIEGARATGLASGAIAVRHVLPNVLPQLVSLALLEMGAVLMLLGELGFVGVFIGGGSETELVDASVMVADVPEWGAILSGARGYLRSVPSLVLYPSLAFLVSVLGFNLLGEGLRRVVREAGVNAAALMSKRLLAVVAAISLLAWVVINQISPNASYADLARRFDGQAALAHAQEITRLQSADPGFGTHGSEAAAAYIVAQLEANGALPAADASGFLQPVTRRLAPRLATPRLASLDGSGNERVRLRHSIDFGEQVYRHGGSGHVDAPLTYVGLLDPPRDERGWRGLDLSGQIAVYLADEAPAAFDTEALIRGAKAVLVISTAITPHTDWEGAGAPSMQTPSLPILHVSSVAFDRLVEMEGASVDALRRTTAQERERPHPAAWIAIPLSTQVRISVDLGQPVDRTGHNVLAILPGQDTAMDEEALILSASYDLAEPNLEASSVAVAQGALGVGTILELTRLWHDEAFSPRRSVLIGIWAGGHLSSTGAATYRETPGVYKSLTVRDTLHLAAVGSGASSSEDLLLVAPPSGQLSSLVLRSAQVTGAPAEPIDLTPTGYSAEIPGTTIAWRGAQELRGNPIGALNSNRALNLAGQIVNLTTITASRQYHY